VRLLWPWPKQNQPWDAEFRRKLSRNTHKKNWAKARRIAIEFAAEAEKRQNYWVMFDAAWSLMRLEVYPRAFELFAAFRRWISGRTVREWDGSSLVNRTLLIDSAFGDVARFMFWSPLLVEVSQLERCVVLTDRRMIPLYQRTFPKLDVRSNADKDPDDVDFVASFERLALYFWPKGPNQTITLEPDQKLVAQFRSRYEGLRSGPFIGISWGSLNRQKGCPGMHDWARLIRATPGTFMSVQYGDVMPALKIFDELVPGRVMSDPSVDQLVDLDRFAAQLCALDVVVSINNTPAHMAGSLGVPTVVILDDQFQFISTWCVGGDRTPWYKATRLVRRKNRAWSKVIDETSTVVTELLASSKKKLSSIES
jgi:hypothetical protein